MENLLRQFNGDVHTKQAVFEYIAEIIEIEAVERLYAGKDVTHIKDAHDLLVLAFDKLNEEYGIKPQAEAKENKAR